MWGQSTSNNTTVYYGEDRLWESSGFALNSVFNNTSGSGPGENLTLSCVAESIQNPTQLPYSDSLLDTVRAFQAIALFLVFSVANFLNILVIVLVVKYKKLRTFSLMIALQIVAMDLILAAIGLIRMSSAIANRWVLGERICALSGTSIVTVVMTRAALMLIFVTDRFLSIFCPFAYPKYQVKIISILSATAWVIPVAVSILAYVLDCYTFSQLSWFCSITASCSRRCAVLSGLILIPYMGPCTIAPLILYAILFVKAQKAKKAMATSQESTKHDWKATITYFLLFITVFAVTVPNFVFLFIVNMVYGSEHLPTALHVIRCALIVVVSLLPITDPILIMRNRDIKEVITEIGKKMLLKVACGHN